MKKILMIVILALALAGCVNAVKHCPLGQTNRPYEPTCFVACDAVGIWFNGRYTKLYPIESAWIKLTWLVWVVDLPCEAVMDTLWLPYDIYNTNRQNTARKNRELNERLRVGAPVDQQYDVNGGYSIRTDDF